MPMENFFRVTHQEGHHGTLTYAEEPLCHVRSEHRALVLLRSDCGPCRE